MYDIVLKSIERNVIIAEKNVSHVERSLKTFVFYPREIGHLISFVYPLTMESDGTFRHFSNIYYFIHLIYSLSDNEQISQRKAAHANLNLLRPCLRRADEFDFENRHDDTYLVNPHVGLKSVGKRTLDLFRTKFRML